MQEELIKILRCPVTRSKFTISILKKEKKTLDGRSVDIIEEGILYTDNDCFYPVIKGIPRLTIEAITDYEDFLKTAISDFEQRKEKVFLKYGDLITFAQKKNKRTKESFTQEWSIFNYEEDKTWDADEASMLDRFTRETDETIDSLKDKIIFDAGCGNGALNSLLAAKGITNLGMDFSNSIEKAYSKNQYSKAYFIQGDVQFPPVAFNYFDIVHSSGVLIATNNTELSFSCLEPTVKMGGKLSVWLYHGRKGFIHNLFNAIRKRTSKLPLKFQYYLYKITIFPVSYIIKRAKGNKQNTREMMIDILDWFSPEFRWEHSQQEATAWFSKRSYKKIQVTTNELFGFNIIGEKKIGLVELKIVSRGRNKMKRLLQKILVNDISWKIIFPFIWISERLKASRLNYKESDFQMMLKQQADSIFKNKIVLHGPFKGMRFGNINPGSSSYYAKLLGSYETEIHPFIQEVIKINYSHVINIGCDEGYYSVGFALCLPMAKISAFDISTKAIENCRALAKLNGVDEKITFGGKFTTKNIFDINTSERILFFADCEGDERFIFTKEVLPLLINSDIIVELHININPTLADYFNQLFCDTHNISIVNSTDDHLKAQTYDLPELTTLEYALRKFITEERIVFMQWMYLKAKKA